MSKMRLGFSVATNEVQEEMKTLEPYVDYYETYSLSDSKIKAVKEYREKITVVHLPDLNNNCIQALEQATKLNIEKAIVHYYTVNPWSYEKKQDTLRKLVKKAVENDIILCLENTEESPPRNQTNNRQDTRPSILPRHRAREHIR